MKVRFHRWYNALLTSLLSMLGYGCSLENGMDMYGTPVICEYGAPHADYIFKGVVTDEAGTPIEGIKTSIKQVYETGTNVYVNGIDSVKTDAEGHYEMQYDGMKNPNTKLIVEDIDGEANGGEFQNDTLDVDFNKAVQTKKGNGWYEGAFEIFKDIKLKKK
jgi:putative lipoprotein (rSAM/lipoprotein system)